MALWLVHRERKCSIKCWSRLFFQGWGFLYKTESRDYSDIKWARQQSHSQQINRRQTCSLSVCAPARRLSCQWFNAMHYLFYFIFLWAANARNPFHLSSVVACTSHGRCPLLEDTDLSRPLPLKVNKSRTKKWKQLDYRGWTDRAEKKPHS